MDSYTILRNNKEYGPYNFKELHSRGLLTTDLIWIEGESAAWRFAPEIEELKPLIKKPEAKTKTEAYKISTPTKINGTETRLQGAAPEIFSKTDTVIPAKKGAVIDDYSLHYLEELETLYKDKKVGKAAKKNFSFNLNFITLGVLLIGVMMGAFIMKQMVDSFGDEQTTVVEAKEIERREPPINNNTHLAQAAGTQPAINEVTKEDFAIREDSVVTIKPIAKTLIAAIQKTDTNKIAISIKNQSTNLVSEKNNSAEADVKPIEEKVEKGSIEEVKKQLSKKNSLEIIANDYKVGMLGGISGLEISVTNYTNEAIDNAVIEIEYLKPNGSVAKSQIVTAQNLAPGASKTIAVPSSNRGVKVRYHLVSTNTKEEIIATDNM